MTDLYVTYLVIEGEYIQRRELKPKTERFEGEQLIPLRGFAGRRAG